MVPALRTLRPSEVPSYLQSSSFYRHLSLLDDDQFSMPSSYYKPDLSITNQHDLELILETIRFWGIDHIPVELIDFCITYDISLYLVEKYKYELPYLSDLLRVSTVKHDPDLMLLNAMRSGYVELVQRIKPQVSQWKLIHLETAIVYGHTSCLQYALSDGATLCVKIDQLYYRSVLSGQLQCVKCLREVGFPLPPRIAEKAVRNNQVHILQYLIQVGCLLTGALYTALEKGKDECLKILVEEGRCDVSACGGACILAVKANSLSCLQYLRQHNSFMRPEVSYNAARYGYLDCLRYAHEQGSPWVGRDCVFAATFNGHIHCLEYLLLQGCVLDERDDLIGVSLRQKNFDVVTFLIQHNCPVPATVHASMIQDNACSEAVHMRQACDACCHGV